ncbi:DUF6311 domain-containing protein [Vreelandella arctica]|uniref:DUF6311 domain-containing protein n=1 Tax=Vreelandella arctica TaxID=3126499 RepID=UPI00300E46A6|tara:strand:+ start:2474 stop:4207 length:1734 start_codon:yes stop_codon:yes gene_type:complete
MRLADDGWVAPSLAVRQAGALLAAALGGGVFAFWLYGWGVINPASVRWLLLEGDPFQHYIGWEAFRHDEWRWPLGALPRFGTTIDASIVFMDAIPLLALPLKLVSAWLPMPFQYQGLVMLFNSMLNALVGAWVAQRLGAKPLLSFLFAILIVLSPIVIMRGIGAHGHEALTAHWLVLAALGMALLPRSGWARELAWLGLLLAAVSIHFYLFFMVGVIWAAAWTASAQRAFTHRQMAQLGRLCTVAVMNVALVLFVMLALGYFQYGLDVGRETGFGYFSAEWMTFINPRSEAWFLAGTELFSGSRVLPGWLSPIAGQYEGQAYAGLGMLAWGLSAVTVALRRMPVSAVSGVSREHATLFVALVMLFVFALGDRWVIGRLVWDIPYPDWTQLITQYLRSSGRLVWPLFYALLLAALWLTARFMSARMGIVVLIIAIWVQWSDLKPLNDFIRDGLSSRVADTRSSFPYATLEDPRLAALVDQSDAIYFLPGGNMERLKPYLWLAAHNDVSINVAYFARSNSEALEIANRSYVAQVSRGELLPSTLYVMTDSELADKVCDYSQAVCFNSDGATVATLSSNE